VETAHTATQHRELLTRLSGTVVGATAFVGLAATGTAGLTGIDKRQLDLLPSYFLVSDED
jgi:hypothetical protein